MKERRSLIVSLVLFVLLIIAVIFVLYQKGMLNVVKRDVTIVEDETSGDVVDWVSAPKNGEFEQPEGFAEERQITDEYGGKSMSEISVGEGSSKLDLLLANNDDEIKEAAERLIEVVDKGKYKCAIDWSDYDISSSEYYVLLSIVGKMFEDKLNGSSDTYRVIVSQPTEEQLEAAGVPVLFDISVDGYLTIYCDVILQNLKNNTEVEELKAFTVYYEQNVLVFKE